MKTKISSRKKPDEHQLPPLLQEAVAAHQAGDLDKAAPIYREFLAQNPEHPTALQLFGLLHSQRGEYETAIELMQQSLQQFPQQAEVANNLANALSSSGRAEEALKNYSQAVKLSPRYADAWRNLGLCHMELQDFEAAGQAFSSCLEISADDAVAWLGLSNVFKAKDDVDQAIDCLEHALDVFPDYAEAHHNLGVCLRLKQKPAEAIKQFETSRQLGLDRAELHQNLGSALVDTQEIEKAIAAYRTAIERNPEDVLSHRNLNTLLWEQELLDSHLQSYRDALRRYPGSEQLTRAYGTALNQKDLFEEAEQVLVEGLRHAQDSSELKSLLAYTLEGQRRWEQALQMHAEAVNTPGSVPNHRVSYARALLACQKPDEALVHADEAVRQMPFNQRAIAYQGLCWRMLGDERDATLNDYKQLIRVYNVPAPAGYASTEEFNQQLTSVLDSLHPGKRHPPEQTLRGGTQSHGDLLNRLEPEIQELDASLKLCVEDYISKFPQDDVHPLWMRRSERFKFSASWSVRLHRSGYHTMHVHPLGWISSAYYVQVPAEIIGSDALGGGIKFGEADIDLGWRGWAARTIQPKPGRLVLFPSYMWHGTVPYESDGTRMTVAFDVVPGLDQTTGG